MATQTSVIESDLLKNLADFKVKPNEDRTKYLARLVKAAVADDNVWKKLSEPTQKWANANIDEAKGAIKSPIDDFPDLTDVPTTQEVADVKTDAAVAAVPVATTTVVPTATASDPAAITTQPATAVETAVSGTTTAPTTDSTPVVSDAAKAEPVDAAEDEATPDKKKGVIEYLRTYVIQNPQATRDEVVKAMADNGFTINKVTVTTTYYDIKGTLKILANMGLVSQDLAFAKHLPRGRKKGSVNAIKPRKTVSEESDAPTEQKADVPADAELAAV